MDDVLVTAITETGEQYLRGDRSGPAASSAMAFAEAITSISEYEKGPCRGKPLSVRGIQKRMEYYARKAKLRASCHQLRHTMATQMLNADAPLVSIQDLLGHNWIMTTQRYCKVSNLKVQRDYHLAMERIVSRYQEQETS